MFEGGFVEGSVLHQYFTSYCVNTNFVKGKRDFINYDEFYWYKQACYNSGYSSITEFMERVNVVII